MVDFLDGKDRGERDLRRRRCRFRRRGARGSRRRGRRPRRWGWGCGGGGGAGTARRTPRWPPSRRPPPGRRASPPPPGTPGVAFPQYLRARARSLPRAAVLILFISENFFFFFARRNRSGGNQRDDRMRRLRRIRWRPDTWRAVVVRARFCGARWATPRDPLGPFQTLLITVYGMKIVFKF